MGEAPILPALRSTSEGSHNGVTDAMSPPYHPAQSAPLLVGTPHDAAVVEARRQRCHALISTVPIPDPFDLHQFLEDLSLQRGKPIMLMAETVSSRGGPCGLLISTAEADYIYCAAQQSLLQAEHTVMHEVGHILFEHGTLLADDEADENDPPLMQDLLPYLSPALIQRMLGRSTYGTEQECEAELFATLLLARVHSRLGEAAVA